MKINVNNSSGIHVKGNKVLVRPKDLEAISKGGIIIPMEAAEKQDMANMYGTVIEIGPMCWIDEAIKMPDGTLKQVPRAEVGDYIIFAKYAGEIFMGNDGVKYRLMNARDVLATKDPSDKEGVF